MYTQCDLALARQRPQQTARTDANWNHINAALLLLKHTHARTFAKKEFMCVLCWAVRLLVSYTNIKTRVICFFYGQQINYIVATPNWFHHHIAISLYQTHSYIYNSMFVMYMYFLNMNFWWRRWRRRFSLYSFACALSLTQSHSHTHTCMSE